MSAIQWLLLFALLWFMFRRLALASILSMQLGAYKFFATLCTLSGIGGIVSAIIAIVSF